jgi:hypothetical protein
MIFFRCLTFFLSHPSVPHSTNTKESINLLNNDQKICYDKIVKYLLECNKEQRAHDSESLKNPNANYLQGQGRQFEINFTQLQKAKKWDNLIHLLERIEETSPERNTPLFWAKTLLNCVNTFQSYQSEIISQQIIYELNSKKLKELEKCQDQLFISVDDVAEVKKKLFDADQTIIKYKEKLELIYHTSKDVITHLKSIHFPDQQVQEFLEFWQGFSNEFKFWADGLSGFSSSPDLFVHIQKKSNSRFEYLHESKIASFLIEEKLINNEIIFELQETNVAITPHYSSSNQADRIVWISPGRQPVSIPIPLRRSSSMVIVGEGYPDMTQNHILEDRLPLPPTCKQARTVVELALNTVNEKFLREIFQK